MVMRIGGIASGIDTEQMVMDLMRAERMKVDKFFRQEEALKWRREALNTTNKTLADFILKARSNFGLTRLTGTGTILKNSIQNFDWVKKVSSGGENIIKATATAAAMEGTYEIEVGQLAEVASVMSKKIQGAKDGEDSNNLLDDKGKFEEDVYGDITIVTKAGSKVFTIGNGEGEITSIDELVKAINNAEVDDSGKKISLGLRAAYDKTLGRLMINAKEMGSDQKIEIEGNSADKFFEKATMENPQGTSNEWYGGIGKDAVVSINGQTVDGLKSNNFSMFGVNYSLQSTGTVTINVETDVDGIFDKVKEFVDNYNELIDHLNDLLNEKLYRDFQPLTKEEKEIMKEKEIEMWEEKAKSGLLRNDETVTRVLQTIRDGLYDSVHDNWEYGMGKNEEVLGGFYHITQIGIATGDYRNGGKLEINEEKLRNAIIDNSEGVVNLLFKTSDINVPSGNTAEARERAAEKRANSGLVDRLFNDMIAGMKDIVRRAGIGEDANTLRNVQSNMLIDFVTSGSISVMDRDIMNMGKRIAMEEINLMKREERYWNQFTAMEKALEQMNQQSAWLMSQLGQMGR